MSRKNKLKFAKPDNSSSQAPADQLLFDKPVTFEVLSAQLQELVKNTPNGCALEIDYIITDIDRKATELEVAKRLIRQILAKKLGDEDTPLLGPNWQEWKAKMNQNRAAIAQLEKYNNALKLQQPLSDFTGAEREYMELQQEQINLQARYESIISSVLMIKGDLAKVSEDLINERQKNEFLQKSLDDSNKTARSNKVSPRDDEEAINKYQDVFDNLKAALNKEEKKKMFYEAALKGKELDYRKLVGQYNEIRFQYEKHHDQSEKLFTAAKNTFETEIQKLSGDMQKYKSLTKKLRKEKTQLMKKYKILRENAPSNLADECNLVSVSSTSNSDESFQSVDNDDERFQNRVTELQESLNNLQSKFDEVCQRLDNTEESLEVQQELNAQITFQSEENQQKHNAEIERLQGLVTKMNDDSQNEVLRVQELERKKTDVLVSVTEEEKDSIRDECESLKQKLKDAEKALEVQKREAKRHLDHEIRKLRKNLKSSEKKKKEKEVEGSLKDNETALAELLKSPNAEYEEKLLQFEKKLESEALNARNLQDMLKKFEGTIDQAYSNQQEKDQLLEDFILLFELSDKENQAALQDEKDKYCALQKQVEISLSAANESLTQLEAFRNLETSYDKMKHDYQTATTDLMNEFTRVGKINLSLQSQLEEMEASLSKNAEECTQVRNENNKLEMKLSVVTNKLEEALSPRKDKISQLQSRLEVIQVAAKAQQKRMEEELAAARKNSLDCEKLHQMNLELQAKALIADDLLAANKTLGDELTRLMSAETSLAALQQKVFQLEQQNKEIQLENAEDRAGLVNELIDTKEKLKECMKSTSISKGGVDKIRLLESQLKAATADLEEQKNLRLAVQLSSEQNSERNDVIDNLFPYLDPVLRQFLRLLSQNQSYMYGILGLLVYAFFIHLYVLL